MNDNRVLRRAAFDLKDSRNCARVKDIGRQAINRFGRQRDDFTRAEQAGRAFYRKVEQLRCVRWQDFGRHNTERGRLGRSNVREPTTFNWRTTAPGLNSLTPGSRTLLRPRRARSGICNRRERACQPFPGGLVDLQTPKG